jgi:hypothetical protein
MFVTATYPAEPPPCSSLPFFPLDLVHLSSFSLVRLPEVCLLLFFQERAKVNLVLREAVRIIQFTSLLYCVDLISRSFLPGFFIYFSPWPSSSLPLIFDVVDFLKLPKCCSYRGGSGSRFDGGDDGQAFLVIVRLDALRSPAKIQSRIHFL